MSSEPNVVMQALLMGSAGAMIAMSGAMLRAPKPTARWTGVVFDLAVAAYAIMLWNDQVGHPIGPVAGFIVHAFAVGATGWFWLFVMALFEDACKVRSWTLVAMGGLTIVGIVSGHGDGGFPPFWYLHNAIQIAMVVHIITIVIRGWKGDLIEARRRLRGPFLIAASLYILMSRGFELAEMSGVAPGWYPMANAAALFVVCLAGSVVFLDARGELYGARQGLAQLPQPVGPARHPETVTQPAANDAQPVNVAPGLAVAAMDRAERADLERLEALMTKEEIWRAEGLTIASLALKVNIPENQLRRLINDRLGYRNFPSYVNAHRIAAAKCRLADPNEARTSISTIAYDLGFASLGPFNRAFREVTGQAPSEWRRQSFNDDTPPGDGNPAQTAEAEPQPRPARSG